MGDGAAGSEAAGGGAVVVEATDERPDGGAEPVDLGRWRDLALGVLVAEGVSGPAELHLAFIDETAMAELNAAHLDGDGPTDVLSFPLDAEPDPATAGPGARLLGDVVICPAVAARQAGAPAGPAYEAEVALLVVHGVLHVLGMDHAEPDELAAMVARERVHLAAVGLDRRP